MASLTEQEELDLAIAIAVAASQAQAKPFGEIAPALDAPAPIHIPSEGFFPQLNAGIANTIGAPVDLVNLGLEQIGLGSDNPIGGSQNLSSIGNTVLGEGAVAVGPPMNGLETFARGGGEAAGALIPMLGVSQRVAQGAGIAANVADDVVKPFMATPLRAGAFEVGAGGGGAVGADIARENDTGVLGEVLGGIAGGLSASVLPSAALTAAKGTARRLPGVSLAARGVNAAVAPFTESGAMEIARRRVQSLSADNIEQAGRLEALPADLSLEEMNAVRNMTPAQRTGDDRLMSLERVILSSNAALSDKFRERTAETSNLLRRAFMGDTEGGNPRDAVAYIRGRRDYYVGLLQHRVAQAEDMARQKVAELDSGQDTAALSTAMRDELVSAQGQAREMEGELWALVPKDAPVSTDNLQSTWSQIEAETPEALQGLIPNIAREMLARPAGVQGNVNEVHGLYSRLGAISRAYAARPGGEQTVRFATMLREAALKDLGAVDPQTDVGRLVNNARAFSLEMNQTFGQGTVGRLLKSAITGGSDVAPELAMDVSVGRRGLVSAVAVDDIRRAVGENGNVDTAIQSYIKNRFQDYAVVDGDLNLGRAQTFMRNNSELLDKYPRLQVELVGAQQAALRAASRGGNAAQIAADVANPRQSNVAGFTEANRGGEIASIFNAENPIQAASQVYAQAARDETGQAVLGYKNALADYLLSNAASGVVDEAGQQVTSGRRLLAAMSEDSTSEILKEAFSNDELLRMRRVAAEMVHVERSLGRLPNVGDRSVTDGPSRLISFVLETVAARQGARLGAGTSGASLKTSGEAVKRMRQMLEGLTEGRATTLLRDAIQDPELFRALMITPDAPDAAMEFANRRVAEWLAGTSAQFAIPDETSDQ